MQKAFHEFGFDLYEGYGLTETAPLVTVNRLGSQRYGSVGRGSAYHLVTERFAHDPAGLLGVLNAHLKKA